jgi:hypothetical protein
LLEYDDTGEIALQSPLPPNTRRRQLVTHDESTFNADDSASFSWKKEGTEWLKPKSKGKGIMEFLCAAQGRLNCCDEEGGKEYITEIIKYGSVSSDDGWWKLWNAEKMVKQTEKAITIFNKAFPGDITVFAFVYLQSLGSKK